MMKRSSSLFLAMLLVATTLSGAFYPRPTYAVVDDICSAYSNAVSRAKSVLSRIRPNVSVDANLPGVNLPNVDLSLPSIDIPGIDLSLGGIPGLGGGSVPVTDKSVQQQVKASQKEAEDNARARSCQNFIERTALATLKKRLLDMMVDQIIGWIQGNGKPQFITDYKAFLKNAGNVAVGDLIQDAGWGRVCEPFRAKLRLQLQLQNTVFSERASCSLNSVINNFEDFYNDFAQGGWLAYNEMWKPANNQYGALILANDEMDRRRAEAERAAELQAIAGKGFTGQTQCNEWKYQVRDAYVGNPVQSATQPSTPPEGYGRADAPSGTWICTNFSVITPGSVSEGLVTKAVGSSLDYLIGSNDLSAYASAIASAAINRLIKEGFEHGGLAELSLPTIDSAPRNEPTGCEGLSGVQRDTCLSNYRHNQYATASAGAYGDYLSGAFENNQAVTTAFNSFVAARDEASSTLTAIFQALSSSTAKATQVISLIGSSTTATTTFQTAQASLAQLQEINAGLVILRSQFAGIIPPQTKATRLSYDYAAALETLQTIIAQATAYLPSIQSITSLMESLMPRT